MARDKWSSAPLASNIGWLERGRLRRQGRKDAKHYRGLNDYTRTHALIVQQAISQAGQNSVNQWLIEACKPFLTGNAGIKVQRGVQEFKIQDLGSRKPSSRRAQSQIESQIDVEREKKSNLEAQFETNLTLIEASHKSAEQAMATWVSRYEQAAAIYTRARANKAKESVASVGAQVPPFDAIPMLEINQSNDAEDNKGLGG
jgi:hypothetical protein